MIRRIAHIVRKIKGSIDDYGFRGTFEWLWNCVLFKFRKTFKKKELNGPDSIKWPDFDEYILSKEEKDKTAEFLFAHPISRTRIITEKLIPMAR